MNINESLKNNKRIALASAGFTVGLISLYVLNNYAEKFFKSKKAIYENKLGLLFGKSIDLGNYSGLGLNGVILENPKIKEIDYEDSVIEAKRIYLGIMPLRSLINRRWVFNIEPYKLNVDVKKDFFQKRKSENEKNELRKNKRTFDIYLKIKNKSNFLIRELGLNTKVKGNILYKSDKRQYIAVLNSSDNRKENLKIKLNTNLKDSLFSFQIFTKGLNLRNLNYEIFNNDLYLEKAKLKSNFSFTKLENNYKCKGDLSFDEFYLKSDLGNSELNSDSMRLICDENKLTLDSNKLNYGSLISTIKLYIPLEKSVNEIRFQGQLGYVDSINPELFISGKLPFWVDKRGLNFGEIDSNFMINKTQLSNLNFFRKNNIRGFITADGKIKGNLNQPKTVIDFNIDYPHFKGIRIRESWEGSLNSKGKSLFLKMNNRYSTIPSFLSLTLDKNLKLDNFFFSRIYDTNKGDVNIIREDNNYVWKANDFPLNELELSLVNNNFDRIKGIINGSGLLSKDQSSLGGKLTLSKGEYRNIRFENSKFDFKLKEQNLRIDSSLYPNDGGLIDVKYRSNDDDLVTVNFSNVSTNWSTLTALDIYKFNNVRVLPSGNLEDLKNIEILNKEKSLDEQLIFIEKVARAKNRSVKEDKLNKYLSKFTGKFNGNLKIITNKINKYNIKTSLKGNLNDRNSKDNYSNNKFSIDLEGGLTKGNGSLKIKQIPFSLINLFFEEPKNFKGGIDLDLNYDLDERSFSSNLSSNKASINEYNFQLGEGKVGFNNSLLDVDMALILNNSNNPIKLKGFIPVNSEKELDLKLTGDNKVFDLFDKLSNKNFSFNKGFANLRLNVKGSLNKPIANGFLFIKDGDINLFSNSLKDFNSTIIFDFDQIEIVDLTAKGIDNGKISLSGSLPFYKESAKGEKALNLVSKRFNLLSKNSNFILDSDINIKRSFSNPLIGGNLSLKNGFINFGGNNSEKKSNESRNKKGNLKEKINWPELYWNRKSSLEIISNESILNTNLFNDKFPDIFSKISFDNLRIKFGSEFRVGYGNIIKAYLITDRDLIINGNVIDNLSARGQVNIKKARANLYTTPFKQDKNKSNFIVFASRGGLNPYVNFSLISKVPDTIFPISENNKENNINNEQSEINNQTGFGSFGIGNTRFIKIEASYKGFLDQLSFEDENQKIKLRSTPSYSRTQIIGLIGGNSANLINRAFISQINGTNAFSERFQLSLYPALIDNNEPINNIFSNDSLDTDQNTQNTSSDVSSSQAWVAELGLDITDRINFAVQTTPDRDDLPPLGILTFQANQYLELLSSFDSKGDWKSKVQLYWRFGD